MTTADANTGAGRSPVSGEPGHRYLELSSITKRFGPTYALDGASLSVGQGIADHYLGDAGNGDDVARTGALRTGVDPVEGVGHVELGYAHSLDLGGGALAAPGHRFSLAHLE